MKNTIRALFLLALLLVLPAEQSSARSAYFTLGEVLQGLISMLVWLNVLWIALFWWFPRTALAGVLGLALLIVPAESALATHLNRLNFEMMQLVDSRLRLRAEGKSIPATLDDYHFSDHSIREAIADYSVSDDGREFRLSYFVLQPGISYSYSSKTGWFYYPD